MKIRVNSGIIINENESEIRSGKIRSKNRNEIRSGIRSKTLHAGVNAAVAQPLAAVGGAHFTP